MDNNNNNNNIDEVKHIVYVSFNNNDSSVSSFISYLIAAFDRQGISTFVDGKSSHDEAVEREMEYEPFSKLRVFVVVFSKNYAFQLTCLEKQILEYSYSNYNNFVVVPVFYGVSKSSVEQHVDSFGNAFEAVQRSMIMWKPGHEYDCKERESEFLEEIASDVFEILYPTEEIGIQSPLKKIENLLCKQPWGVRTIGIVGGPGIGKTTLARAFFRRISHGYDDSCFIKDFHKEYNQKRLEFLPPEYFIKTPMEKLEIKNFDSQPSHRKKWVLVALDDVRNAQDAKSFLGGFDKFGPGSLIIIISEKIKVLEECQMNEIYELKGLKDEDAVKLFTRCAFGNGVVDQNLLDLSMRVVKFSDGNPRALRSLAEKLMGKEMIESGRMIPDLNQYPRRSCAKELMVKAMVEMGRAIPDDCDVLVTGHDGSCDIEKNTYLRITPCEEDNDPQETKDFPSDHNVVLTNEDTKTIILTPSHSCTEREFRSYSQRNPGFGLYNSISKSLPSHPIPLEYNSVMRSLSEHLYRKHNILLKGFVCELQKHWQSFSNSRDLDHLENHLQLLFKHSGCCVEIKRSLERIQKNREPKRKGSYGIKETRSGTHELLKIKHDRDQPNGLGLY